MADTSIIPAEVRGPCKSRFGWMPASVGKVTRKRYGDIYNFAGMLSFDVKHEFTLGAADGTFETNAWGWNRMVNTAGGGGCCFAMAGQNYGNPAALGVDRLWATFHFGSDTPATPETAWQDMLHFDCSMDGYGVPQTIMTLQIDLKTGKVRCLDNSGEVINSTWTPILPAGTLHVVEVLVKEAVGIGYLTLVVDHVPLFYGTAFNLPAGYLSINRVVFGTFNSAGVSAILKYRFPCLSDEEIGDCHVNRYVPYLWRYPDQHHWTGPSDNPIAGVTNNLRGTIDPWNTDVAKSVVLVATGSMAITGFSEAHGQLLNWYPDWEQAAVLFASHQAWERGSEGNTYNPRSCGASHLHHGLVTVDSKVIGEYEAPPPYHIPTYRIRRSIETRFTNGQDFGVTEPSPSSRPGWRARKSSTDWRVSRRSLRRSGGCNFFIQWVGTDAEFHSKVQYAGLEVLLTSTGMSKGVFRDLSQITDPGDWSKPFGLPELVEPFLLPESVTKGRLIETGTDGKAPDPTIYQQGLLSALVYVVDASPWLTSGEVLTEAVWSIDSTDIVIDRETLDGVSACARIGGGIAGTTYETTVTITTSENRSAVVTFDLSIETEV